MDKQITLIIFTLIKLFKYNSILMTSYAYISGTSGTDATITFDGVLGAPTAFNNLGAGPSSNKTIGFEYTSDIISTVTTNIVPSQGSINVYYIISDNQTNSTQNFNASSYYKSITGLNTTNLGTVV